MGWASEHIVRLQKGDTVQFRPRGNSMRGKIESGQLRTVVPVRAEHLNVGDIVLCKVNGFRFLHLIKAIQGKRFQWQQPRKDQRLDWGEWNLRQVHKN